MFLSKNPVYNLKAVLQKTGLKADVLRAWERRYGLPAPERTQGGHRLYSDFDVALLKWLLARQGDGMSISRATELWKEHLAAGRDPLAEIPVKPANSLVKLPQPMLSVTALEALRAQWLTACLNFNETSAEQALNQAFALYPVETVCFEVLQRGLAEMGNLWYENGASVQQEHFASALALRRLDTLLAASPVPIRPQTILIGCPPDEWHSFSSLLLTLFLRRRGLNVIYLGANVPTNRFEETLASIQPHLTILSAQHLNSAASLAQAASLLQAHGATVAYGGRIFNLQPELTRHISGHYLGETLETGLEKIESLLVSQADSPQAILPSAEHLQTLKIFQLKRPLVENTLNEQIQPFGVNPEYFITANQFMGNNLVAALQLGSLSFIDSELDWLATLIRVHYLPQQVVSAYLGTYARAVETHLGENGRVIVEWLQNHAD